MTWSTDANYIYSGSSDGYVLMLRLINNRFVSESYGMLFIYVLLL